MSSPAGPGRDLARDLRVLGSALVLIALFAYVLGTPALGTTQALSWLDRTHWWAWLLIIGGAVGVACSCSVARIRLGFFVVCCAVGTWAGFLVFGQLARGFSYAGSASAVLYLLLAYWSFEGLREA